MPDGVDCLWTCLAWAIFDLSFVHDGWSRSARAIGRAASSVAGGFASLFGGEAEGEAKAAEKPARVDDADGLF